MVTWRLALRAPLWASLLLPAAPENMVRGPFQESEVNATVAVLQNQTRLIISPFEGPEGRGALRFSFQVQWISPDGAWVGGRTPVDIFSPKPPCLFVQNIKTERMFRYCDLVRNVDHFAFSNDLKLLAVLGVPSADARAVKDESLVLFDLVHPAKPPMIIMSGLEHVYISRLSFTKDGRWLTFGRGTDVCTFDTQNGAVRTLAKGTNPALSPDSTHLTYEDSAGHLILRDMSTGTEIVIGETIGVSSTWSPDGEKVLYTRPFRDSVGNNGEVVVYHLKTGRTVVLDTVYTLGDKYWWVVR